MTRAAEVLDYHDGGWSRRGAARGALRAAGNGRLSLAVGASLPLAEAATAPERASKGANGGPVVLSI